MKDAKLKIALAGLLVIFLPLVAMSLSTALRPAAPGAYGVSGMDPMTLEEAEASVSEFLPVLLLSVYDGFAQTDEQLIYDALELAAHGDALEALYLERAGALARGGLTQSDQAIHEMRLKAVSAEANAGSLMLDATWEVIGSVGHSEHLHVRGNTYRADLVVAPVDDAWKIVAFDLTDVDRSGVGEFIEVDRTWAR